MDAVELVLEAVGATGRQVVVPANCYAGIPAMILTRGATPVPVPVDDHFAPVLDASLMRRAPIVYWVHHLGVVAPDAGERITALRKAGCTVVEDCAYVMFGDDDPVGRWGDATIVSFGPTKPNSGSGGGAVVSRDTAVIEAVTSLRDHGGQEPAWRAGRAASAIRGRTMSEFEAVVAYQQWRARHDRRARLTALARRYAERLGDRFGMHERSVQPTWGRLTVDVAPANGRMVQRRLAEEHKVRTSCMYAEPWFDYPWLQEAAGARGVDWTPLRTALQSRLCVPLHPAMSEGDVDQVCAALTVVVDDLLA